MRSDAEREGFGMCVERCLNSCGDSRRMASFYQEFRPNSDGPFLEFSGALSTRLLHCCIVDADFRDTETYFHTAAGSLRQVSEPRPIPAFEVILHHSAGLSGDGDVNQRHRILLTDCLAAATQPSGLSTLTAPTRSGKTLGSLAFALQNIAYDNAPLPESSPRPFPG